MMKALNKPCLGDGFVLSSGIEVYCNRGVLGIDSNDMSLTEGYDGHINDIKLSQKDRQEIAEHMISLWEKWRTV